MKRTTWTALAITAMLMAGCNTGDDGRAAPPKATTQPATASCNLAPDYIAESPWVLSIPC